MVPLAFNTVGKSRFSTLTVWNSSGWSTIIKLGSTTISCFVGAALVSLEQATETSRVAKHRNRAADARRWTAGIFGAATGGRPSAAAPQGSADCAALELKLNKLDFKILDCDVMGLPRGPRPDSIGWRQINRIRSDLHRPAARCGIHFGR